MRVGKFFKKMFAGVNALLLDDEMTRIEGMASREGEEVRFETPIVLKDFSKINDWLLRFEQEMKTSLALTLKRSSRELFELLKAAPIDARQYLSWMSGHPAQIVTLAHQIVWTTKVEDLLNTNNSPDQALELVHNLLDTLAVAVLTDLSSIERRKCESVITELVYERDVIRGLIEQNVFAPNDFAWLSQMRFYHSAGHSDVLSSVEVKMADASLPYGFEYLGVPDRLVQTPLTTRCYLSLTQALKSRLGGSPFGPAGTGSLCGDSSFGIADTCVQVRQSLLKLSVCSSVDSFLSSVATRLSTSKPWAAYSSAFARSAHGDASMNSIDSKSESCPRSRNRFRLFSSASAL